MLKKETLINELARIQYEIKTGRYEEAYIATEDLKNELITNVLEETIDTKKEPNTSAGNEDV